MFEIDSLILFHMHWISRYLGVMKKNDKSNEFINTLSRMQVLNLLNFSTYDILEFNLMWFSIVVIIFDYRNDGWKLMIKSRIQFADRFTHFFSCTLIWNFGVIIIKKSDNEVYMYYVYSDYHANSESNFTQDALIPFNLILNWQWLNCGFSVYSWHLIDRSFEWYDVGKLHSRRKII